MFTIPVLDIKSDPLDALLAVVGYRLSMLLIATTTTSKHSLLIVMLRLSLPAPNLISRVLFALITDSLVNKVVMQKTQILPSLSKTL